MTKDRLWLTTYCVVMVLGLYVAVASFCHAIRNPELTQTQVFLDFWKAMTWN